jgi:hypothetical protein
MTDVTHPLLGINGLFAMGIEGFLILLVIAGISSVAEWLKKKRQRDQSPTKTSEHDWSTPASHPASASAPSTEAEGKPLSQWEEEIRRMLQGLDPQPSVPPPLPPPPPPIVRQSPPPVYQSRPVVVEDEGVADEPVPTYLSSMETPDSAYQRAAGLEQSVDGRLAKVGSLGSAAEAWIRAGAIDDRAQARMMEAANLLKRGQAGKVDKPRSDEADRLVAAFRNPATARQALIASFVLSPPKALES